MPWSVIPWGFWAVHADRCTPGVSHIVLVNCTLVLSQGQMSYMYHW
jgi:hypothetical protein